MTEITFADFEKIDIRVGRITFVQDLVGGKYSSHVLSIDFGEKIGVKKSCVRLIHYSHVELQDRLVLAVVNFPPRQIGQHMSEVLTLGVPDAEGECVLIQPDKEVGAGVKLF